MVECRKRSFMDVPSARRQECRRSLPATQKRAGLLRPFGLSVCDARETGSRAELPAQRAETRQRAAEQHERRAAVGDMWG
jgi:hypothetical protein